MKQNNGGNTLKKQNKIRNAYIMAMDICLKSCFFFVGNGEELPKKFLKFKRESRKL